VELRKKMGGDVSDLRAVEAKSTIYLRGETVILSRVLNSSLRKIPRGNHPPVPYTAVVKC